MWLVHMGFIRPLPSSSGCIGRTAGPRSVRRRYTHHGWGGASAALPDSDPAPGDPGHWNWGWMAAANACAAGHSVCAVTHGTHSRGCKCVAGVRLPGSLAQLQVHYERRRNRGCCSGGVGGTAALRHPFCSVAASRHASIPPPQQQGVLCHVLCHAQCCVGCATVESVVDVFQK